MDKPNTNIKFMTEKMTKLNNKLMFERRNLFNEILLMQHKTEKLRFKFEQLLKLHMNIKMRLGEHYVKNY